MMEEPPPRYWTNESQEFLSTQLGLPNEVWMQDWAYEVANPSDLDKYLTLFAKVHKNADVRFTLADIIIQAFEELEQDLEHDGRWVLFIDELARDFETHAYQIWYWSAFDSELKDAWRVSPFMRSVSQRSAL